jgi:D-alanyl-lipoteichoic acid acyltransferase DltB (MBOAT superfamily)
MKTLHRIFGVLVILAFLLTGQFMDFHNPKVREMTDEGARMMFRSRHIYILLAGLINLGVGVYFVYWRERWRKRIQMTGSILLIIAPLMMIVAFFYEPTLKGLQRPLTLPAIVALLVGVFFHLFSGVKQGKDSTAS